MSVKEDGVEKPQGAKVLKLGLNISVSGDPGTDFEILLDDNGPKSAQPLIKNAIQYQPSDSSLPEQPESDVKHEVEEIKFKDTHSTGAIPKYQSKVNMNSSESPTMSEAEKAESKDSNILDKIKMTMEHFEKFSDHIREIPRLRNRPLMTSTPFSDKQNSKSELSLVQSEYRPRKFSHLYDFHSRREYGKNSMRPPDLFLKPLPGENFYKRGMYSRYFDFEPYRHYGSDNSLNRTSDYNIICTKSKTDIDKYDLSNFSLDQPVGILKKSDSESGDKHSTSSADSVKDIKIYQSGGILIMQNFKDNMDALEKKEMSEFSAKLIENCNKLRDEISSFQTEKPFENFTDENKNSGKTVQFDLTGTEAQKSKSSDSFGAVKDDNSFSRLESSESTSDCPKTKDNSPQGTSQSQDFPSLSTQENDSIISNQPGMSPTFVSPKKLEWDSGADIGYMNLDLTKENLSTIERIVLKGLSSDGLSEKNVVYEKKPEKNQTNRSKFILERIPSDLMMEETAGRDKIRDVLSTSDSSNKEKELDKGKKCKKVVEEGIERKNSSSSGVSKGETRLKCDESKSSSKENTSQAQRKEKRRSAINKAVNVNTLWENVSCEISLDRSTGTESLKQSECSKLKGLKLSPKVKKVKKKRPSAQRAVPSKDNSPIARRCKSSIDTPSLGMGLPKKNHKNVEAIPALNDAELSKEVEEIVVDQRYKQSDDGKVIDTPTTDKTDNKTEAKNKSRPISASSGSNNTVLPKPQEEKPQTAENKFVNQIIQTNELDCESIGIQAFSSQVSSECEMKNYKREVNKGERENVNTSSKNIQAFGLNASLPKQLEHPKEPTQLISNQNTKSTQFFGGPVNSLPNYHCNLVTKPGESCGRAPQVLKAKKNLEAEIIRLKEENEKNILANDVPKTESKRRSSNENKENLISKKSTKTSHSSGSRKTSKGNESVSRDSEKESEPPNGKAKKSHSGDGTEGLHTSDEVSSLVLTSEVLKVHGDSVDRNIIQEKYFQSQLAEFELRKMISRSTSMELEMGAEGQRNYTSTACQYSPQSKEDESGEQSKHRDDDSSKGKPKRVTPDEFDLSQNVAEDGFETLKSTNQGQYLGAGDSLPSSTQTAHSWVAGIQNSGENVSGVGRARSFEYLPGHIYESSGNLREELPSETEQNLITSSSDSDTAKRSPSDRAPESEGRNTLVLENSTESSENGDRLKILDGNLTQLNFAVLKLREKDAQVQSVTRSLLANLWKKNGSGDCFILGEADAKEVGNMSSSGKERGDTPSDVSGLRVSKKRKEKEVSIACQTEDKSSSSEPERFYEEKKALERRISAEKKCQIKWIESEIRHLNVLRGLLEKQSYTRQRKKAQSETSNDASRSEKHYPENISTEAHSRPVTPVYGCTISLTENNTEVEPQQIQMEGNSSQWCRFTPEESQQYGMAVSLSGKDKSKSWRRVVMLPVGVQVSLKDAHIAPNCEFEETNNENVSQPQNHYSKSCALENRPPVHSVMQSDVNTQYPSARRPSGNFPTISVQTSTSPTGRCNQCNEENCVCLNLEKSYSSLSRSSRSRRGSSKLTSLSEEPEIENDNENADENRNKANYPTAESLQKYVENAWDSSGSNSKPKSVHSPKCKHQNIVSEKSEGSNNHEKRKDNQNPDCMCQNCLIQVSSSISRSDCRCNSQPNIYLNIDKSSADFGACGCSKGQRHKQSNCHIIKIHGSKCCSPGKGSCCCKSRTTAKQMENQSSQTDLVFPNEESKTASLEKNRLDVEMGQSQSDAKAIRCPNCGCDSKATKEKTKIDDHPRHYFLRIEETEVDDDDSQELTEQKKSLEVITVTVPVKKAGKAKIYGKKMKEVGESHQVSDKSVEFLSNGCNCCSECVAHRLKSAQEYEPRSYQKSVAEKPESPRRACDQYLKQTEYRTYETNAYDGFAYPEQFEEYSSRECSRNGQTGYYPEQLVNDNHSSQCYDGCKCLRHTGTIQEVPKEYDSHKKSRNGNAREYYQRSQEDRRSVVKQKRIPKDPGRSTQEWSSDSRNSREGYNYDYYNYNKREFMTKSELLKEEEQKRKQSNPSLQECLSSNRPDFYSSAERRRQIIAERAKERVKKHSNRMECLIDLIHRCNEREQVSNGGPKRIFTTVQMREQTMKRYRKLPEVTGKLADQKKREEYRTNKLMADIFAKKLQSEALKGHINLSNSVALLHTI